MQDAQKFVVQWSQETESLTFTLTHLRIDPFQRIIFRVAPYISSPVAGLPVDGSDQIKISAVYNNPTRMAAHNTTAWQADTPESEVYWVESIAAFTGACISTDMPLCFPLSSFI